MNQSNFEFNKNAVYLRNRDLTLHYKKLQEIHTRKNGYFGKSENFSRSDNKKNYYTEHQLKIKKDNNYLIGKLNQISKREVSKPIFNDIFTYQTSRHYLNIQNIKKMKDKYLQEENLNMLKRLQEGTSVMNREKFENNYKNHLKLKKLYQKVDTRFNTIYKENTLSLISSKSKLPLMKTARESGLQSSRGLQSGYTNVNKIPDSGKKTIKYKIEAFEMKN